MTFGSVSGCVSRNCCLETNALLSCVDFTFFGPRFTQISFLMPALILR